MAHAILLHRSIIGNSGMDAITLLNNATLIHSSLESLMRSIHFNHKECPEYPFRWKNMFLLCIVDKAKHYKRGVECIMMIIWRWFAVRRGGHLGLISERAFKRSYRHERERNIATASVRNEILWVQEWVLVYYNTD